MTETIRQELEAHRIYLSDQVYDLALQYGCLLYTSPSPRD